MTIAAAYNDAATIGNTEYYLGADSTSKSLQTLPGRYKAIVSFGNMTASEVYTAKLYRTINGSEVSQEIAYLIGVQSSLLEVEFDGLAGGWDISVTKVSGTDRSISWTISRDDLTGYALSTAGVAAIVTAALTTQMTESYAADGVAPTLAEALFAIQQWEQERVVSGTSLAVKKLDGITNAMTFTLNSATAPTSVTRAT